MPMEYRLPFSRKHIAQATMAPGIIAPFACPNDPRTSHPNHMLKAGIRMNHNLLLFALFIDSSAPGGPQNRSIVST